jgi:DNA processing protein
MMRIERLAPVHSGEVWLRGALPDLSGRRTAVAVVGARTATARGLEMARRIARGLAERGVVIISGGALGIDAAAHRGALEAGGSTLAVLGTGVDVPYPARHRALFDSIIKAAGALVSPFPPGTGPRRWQFPRRNQLIAALAQGVVVVEAQARSGALGTAREARALGRCVMAVPGSAGCDVLAAGGAFAVETADEVVDALAGRRRERPRPDGDLGRVLAALAPPGVRTVEEVAASSGLPQPAAHAALLRLTLMGYVARLPGERYKLLEMVA